MKYSRMLACAVMAALAGCTAGAVRRPPAEGVAAPLPSYSAVFRTAARLETGRYGHAAAALGDDIYIVGGSRRKGFLGSVERYDTSSGTVETVTGELLPRRYLTAEAWDGKIYVMGGQTGDGKVVGTVERYDPATGEVMMLSPMKTPRLSPSSVVRDGKIYVIGGGIASGERVGTVEIYDIAADTWSEGSPMPTARECDSVARDGKIYAAGGYDGEGAVRSFEVYDIEKDRWERLPDLPFPLSAHHAVVAGDTLYTFGDYAEPGRVCAYDFVTGKWRELETDYEPSRHNAVVLVGDTVYVTGGTIAASGPRLDDVQSARVAALEQSPVTPEPTIEEKIYSELREIRKLLEEGSSGRTVSRRRGKRRSGESRNRAGRAEASGDNGLSKLDLPANPTKDEAREYVQALADASRKQKDSSSADPWREMRETVGMLEAVGPEHLDVLIAEALKSQKGTVSGYYLPMAINSLAREEHKEMILGALPDRPRLIGAVVENGWVEEARPLLIEKLRGRPKWLPKAWIRVVATFENPEVPGLLQDYLVYGKAKESTYEIIKDIPGVKLEETVGKAWEVARNKGEGEMSSTAPVALEFGHADALEHVVKNLDSGSDYLERKARELLMKYTDAFISADGKKVRFPDDDEIKAWYARNKEKLVFDTASKRFRTPGRTGGAGEEASLSVVAEKLEPGDAVPDFTAPAIDGSTITLSDLKGKVVLLDFWATWCGPCLAEMPTVQAAYKRYHDRGFEVIGVSRDTDRGRLEKYLKENEIAWPQIFDGKMGRAGLAGVYGVRGIPRPILLGRDLRVHTPNARGSKLDKALAELFPGE